MTKRIEVAKAPAPKSASPMRLLATLCYFYPQYTLAAARRLPYKHVTLLLSEAQRQEAARNHSLTQIVSAPHTKDGQAVQELLTHYRSLMDGKR
jgi:hypothetical protein